MTLKQTLEPPFHKSEHDPHHIRSNCNYPIITINSFAFSGEKNGKELLNDFSEWLIALMNLAIYNEKWERDFSEPMRWVKVHSLGVDFIDCPKCKFGIQEGTKDLNFCPNCGKKLDPPDCGQLEIPEQLKFKDSEIPIERVNFRNIDDDIDNLDFGKKDYDILDHVVIDLEKENN